MHIPNAVLDPRMAAATWVVGAAGLAYGVRALDRRVGERSPVLMGTMAAFVFAAQMVNFPLWPLPVSGHLLGGVLAAALLGPWAGAVVMAAVLIVQCLMFGDGGLTALGANFVNMGLLGAVGGYAVYEPARRAIGGDRGVVLGAMVAAWFSVLLTAGAFAVEVSAFGGRAGFVQVLAWMALVHAGIGVGEAVITGLVLRSLLLTRPDLVYRPGAEAAGKAPAGRASVALGGLAVALAVAVFLAPFADEHADGLEFVGQRLGLITGEAPASLPVPVPDYRIPGFQTLGAATAAAGLIGTLTVFAVGAVLARVFRRKPSEGPGRWDGVSADAV